MATNIGPKIGVEGEAEYRKSINQIIQQAKTLDAQMRATVSSFNSTTSAEEKAAAKSKILSEQITTQKERIRTLTDMMQKSAAKYGENDARTLKWREAVLNATTALNGMEQELADVNSGLDETGDNLKDASAQAVSFGDILKANVLSDVIMDGFRKLGGYIKDFASGMVEAAAEVSAQNAQFEQTFGSMANSATKNLQKIADETGIIPERLKATYTQMYAYAKSTGTGKMINSHGFTARPQITVTGSGKGTVTVGSRTVTINKITSGMILDSLTQNAYLDSSNLNGDISAAEFPTLLPGESEISFTGGVTALDIVPRWWTL